MYSNPAIARKVMAPQKFYNFFQQGTQLEKIEGTKFSNINTKNTFYGTITLAESESDVRKILKKFWKKLWAKNFSGLKLFWPITSQDLSGPHHIIYSSEIQGTLYKIGYSNPVSHANLKNRPFGYYSPTYISPTLSPRLKCQTTFL